MKRFLRLLSVLLLALALGGVLAWAVAPAAPTTGESMGWVVVPAGGMTYGQGDGIALGSTIGQPAAGSGSGGEFTTESGWWAAAAAGSEAAGMRNYLPFVVR